MAPLVPPEADSEGLLDGARAEPGAVDAARRVRSSRTGNELQVRTWGGVAPGHALTATPVALGWHLVRFRGAPPACPARSRRRTLLLCGLPCRGAWWWSRTRYAPCGAISFHAGHTDAIFNARNVFAPACLVIDPGGPVTWRHDDDSDRSHDGPRDSSGDSGPVGSHDSRTGRTHGRLSHSYRTLGAWRGRAVRVAVHAVGERNETARPAVAGRAV